MPLLQGVYAAAVTPRRLGMQDINLGVMWDLIDFLCERRIQGISLLGSTGEFIHYSNSERMRMMGLAPKRSRVPVIINVSHSNLDGSVELAPCESVSISKSLRRSATNRVYVVPTSLSWRLLKPTHSHCVALTLFLLRQYPHLKASKGI